MSDLAIVISGLPQSGKTTYLAALWHLVSSREIDTVLQFGSLSDVESSHLNAIAERWRDARPQDRTSFAFHRLVRMKFKDARGIPVSVTFPDITGEAFRRMWEERECDTEVAQMIKAGLGVLLFIHADDIQVPGWVVDMTKLSRKIGIDIEPGKEIEWSPKLAPTQVQLVDLLQLFRSPQLDAGPRKLAIMLSAWDTVMAEGLIPSTFLATRLPLLDQYLKQRADEWHWKVYGVSAQGGEYEQENQQVDNLRKEQLRALREMDMPSKRIRLVSDIEETKDLTEPIAWLMG